MERKRLLLLSDAPNLNSGLARCTRELAKRFILRYDVAVAGWHHIPLPHPYPYFIYPLRKGHQQESNQLNAILARFDPHIILCIGDIWNFGYMTGYRDAYTGLKSVAWLTVDGEYLLDWSEILNSFDQVTSFSDFGVKELQKYDVSADISRIYPGVNPEDFYLTSKRPSLTATKMGSFENTFIALVVSQNTDRKNIPITMEAFSEFAKDKDDVLLFMVTDPVDVAGYNLWALEKKLILGKKLLITRNCSIRKGIEGDALNLIMNAATVMINSSIGEGIGLPLLEAQATRTIPIATNYASAVEVVRDNGRLIEVAAPFYGELTVKRALPSHSSLVRHLEDLYHDWRGDKKLITEYGDKGIQFAKNLSWEKTVDSLDRKIQDALTEKTRRWEKKTIKIKEIKLLMVIPSWGKVCGIAEYTKSLVEILRDKGQKVDIYAKYDLLKLCEAAKKGEYNTVHIQFMSIKFLKYKNIPFTYYDKQSLEIGNCKIYILSNINEAKVYNLSSNNRSGILKIVYGSTSFLFTGDAEKRVENILINNYQSFLDADVLKVVESVCKVLNLTLQQAADAFGDYWVNDYAVNIYKFYYRHSNSAKDFLLNMDNVHIEVTKNIPNAHPPRFTYNWENDKTLIMTYNSHRDLIDFLIGLVKGVGKYFNEDLKVKKLENDKIQIDFP